MKYQGCAASRGVAIANIFCYNDQSLPVEEKHLDEVLRDAAGAVADLRAEGKTVLLHCVAAQSRTPTVAALYAALHLGVDPRDAVRDVVTALPDAAPNPHFQAAIRRLTTRDGA